jgi:polar amino acid transport system substrate-binding protein
VTLATTDWCPYACPPPSPQLGFVYEYVTEIAKRNHIDLEIKFYPWARAVLKVNSGEIDGLLTAVPEEAPSLLFTTEPIMSYQVCVFTASDSKWMYDDENSFSQIRLGVIDGYGYGAPLDAYIKNSDNHKQLVTLTGTEGVKRLFLMLQSRRMDAFIDDQYVVKWSAMQNGIKSSAFKNAGCINQNPFYLAVNPKMPLAQEFITFMSESFAKKENQLLLSQLVKKYEYEMMGATTH